MMTIKPLYGAEYASSDTYGVLLINLGSPKSPDLPDVKRYLSTFLNDERVIGLTPTIRRLLVDGIIVPRRAKYSASNYAKIWDDETQTFPLVRHSALLAQALAHYMHRPVALAMRYGLPDMDEALTELNRLGLRHVRVLPLYPHYTRSSYESAAVHALERCRALELPLELDIVPAFYRHKGYRRVLANSIYPYLSKPFDRLIVSMHGIPVSHLSRPCRADNGNTHYCLTRLHSPQEANTCYRLQCESTTEMLRQDLALDPSQVEQVYQSRLGRHEWMRPYFAERVKCWAHEDVRDIVVVCPGFISDCLETIHEIDVEYRQEYIRHGGTNLTYVPCLNSSPAFVEVLADIISEHKA